MVNQLGYARVSYTIYRKYYTGPCHKVIGACFRCGWIGHLRRDCLFIQSMSSHESVQPSPHPTSSSTPPFEATFTSTNKSMLGKGNGKWGQSSGQRQARVYAITRQDARMSNAIVTEGQNDLTSQS
ncbi:uncharacterized protein LOC129318895 isoform X2 [Prosopis cineraria]|uniref:uncharacterized protein LOC129318895 isoform X2 n=1 Tax=Prosopis cineraria TaxID=364024 RepID=UPI00240EA835|nr:uncharacterized protein LOC129318895 isoform X2 [Prosopis cineraria]